MIAIRSAITIAIVVSLAVSGTAMASTHSYNYSFDWSAYPWSIPGQNLQAAADNAKQQQDLADYVGLSYYSAEPNAITHNLGSSSLRHLFLVGHARPGMVLVSRWSPYPGTNDYAGVVSSNIPMTGGVPFKLHDNSASQIVRQTSYVSDVNSSAKIAMFLGCETGADPPPGSYNLLWSAHGHAGVAFAGGFRESVVFSHGIHTPPTYFGYRYWRALRSGYNAWYSMEVARAYIHQVYGANGGYDSMHYRGDGNTRM